MPRSPFTTSLDRVAATYTLIGGEETYKNKLNQSPLAFRKLQNFIPSLRGDLEQAPATPSFSIPAGNVTAMFPYRRVESDGSVTRILLAASDNGKVYKFVGAATAGTELFPSASGFPVLKQTPAFVQANNNLVYFTDNERFYCTDGTNVIEGGLPHPVDAPTFTTAAGTLNVATARYYWVSWADVDGVPPEFNHISNSSPRSASTGALTAKAVTVTRPNHPPPRASHWYLWASQTDGDAVFGALLAVIPVATTTFVDQSPFLDQTGTAMVAIQRPIRNGPMIPANFAYLHKGRIFVCGFNRVPCVIRNPSFENVGGSGGLSGWTQSPGANETFTAETVTVFDGSGSFKIARTAGVGGIQGSLNQDVSQIFKPGRRYRIEVSTNLSSVTGSASIQLRISSASDGVLGILGILSNTDTVGVWNRDRVLNVSLAKIPSDLQLQILSAPTGATDAITGFVDFIRVWEIVVPSQIGYSALEEVEGLRNGRGEESFPGSTPTPNDLDASDVVNLLSYPQEASELISMAPFSDGLVIFSNLTAVPLYGSSFDDFGFSEQVTLGTGSANRFSAIRTRHGLYFVSGDFRVFKTTLDTPTDEISLPLRDTFAKIDQTDAVWLEEHDFGKRSWLAATYLESGGTRKLRIYDHETGVWFSLTSFGSPKALVSYEAVAGKRVLLVSDGGTIFVIDDQFVAYTIGGVVPAAIFRQVLFDADDPASFKVWKEIAIHTNGSPTGNFWLDPTDPDTTTGATAIGDLNAVVQPNFAAVAQIPGNEFQRAFLTPATNSYGKRLLLEVTLPSGAVGTQKAIYGLEIVAERSTRYAQ